MNSMKGLYGPRSSSSSASASTTSSPCAACKFLKRRCAPSCIFAPYFKSDEPRKFASVHKIFGASNVSKLLGQVPVELRDEAAATLTYEAEARLRDPVYGCVGDISLLQWKKMRLQEDLAQARVRLARYVNSGFIIPSASSSLSSPSPSPSSSASCYAPVGFFDDPDVRAQLGIYGFGDVGGGTGLSDVTDFQHR